MGRAAACLVAACAGVVILGSNRQTWGVDKNWTAKSGGNFERAAAWSPRGAPGINDRAIFDLAGRKGARAAYTVKFTSDPTNLGAWVKQGVITWDLGGHAYAL